jgi:glycosyltransferase involved in cell wall biosynthesis
MENAPVPWTRGTVYVGPVEIAGQYAAIVAALRTQGVPCHLHLRFDHPFSYATEDVHPGRLMRVHRWIIRKRESRSLPHVPHRVALEGLRRVVWSAHAVAAITRYRTFVFAFGMTFANGHDLPLLRLLGKRVIVVLSNGSEARAPYVDGNHLQDNPAEIAAATRSRRRLLRRIERWASVVVGAPLSSSTLMERPFVDYFAVGMPRPAVAEDGANGDHRSAGSTVRVLHAPSKTSIKGTDLSRAAVQQLIEAGHAIEYEEITGASNDEVLERLAECDLVVDQAFSDTPMATLTAEAAAEGTPTVVGGYGWDELRAVVPDAVWPPSALCRPDRLRETIEQLVTDAHERSALGARAREFVRTRWSEREVGARWLRVLTRDVPEDWWVDPLTVIYTHGCGIAEPDARRMVATLVDEFGVQALCLGHNPELERAFLEFAASADPEPLLDDV